MTGLVLSVLLLMALCYFMYLYDGPAVIERLWEWHAMLALSLFAVVLLLAFFVFPPPEEVRPRTARNHYLFFIFIPLAMTSGVLFPQLFKGRKAWVTQTVGLLGLVFCGIYASIRWLKY